MTWRRTLFVILGVVGVLVFAAAAFLGLAIYGSNPLLPGARLADGRIEILSDGIAAIYLVELEEGGLALIDAGFDAEAKAIKSALDERGREASAIEAIFITHGHGDHIAGALAFPNAALYVLSPDADLVEGRRAAQSPFARNRAVELTGLTVTHSLADGEIVTVGGTSVEVFAVPGHSLGSAAYLVHGVLFLGDSAASARDGMITAAPPVFSADTDQAKQSLIALADRLAPRADEIEALAFGHQGTLEGLQPLTDWAEVQRP